LKRHDGFTLDSIDRTQSLEGIAAESPATVVDKDAVDNKRRIGRLIADVYFNDGIIVGDLIAKDTPRINTWNQYSLGSYVAGDM